MTASEGAHDRFWRHVFGEAYRELPQGPDLTPIEKQEILDLCQRFAAAPDEDAWLDRDHGVTTDRTDPDAWQIRRLTMDRLDTFAARVWADSRDHDGSWSVKPDDPERALWAAEDRIDDEAKRHGWPG